MTSINNYQCHYTLIKKMMTSKPEDRLRKKGVKTRKYYKWLRWSMKYMFTQNDIRKFQNDYRGLDVSNKVKALESQRIVKARLAG